MSDPLRSPEVNELVAALSAAQGEFPQIKKSKTAKILGKNGLPGYEYQYADLADIREAVTPALAKNKLAVIHSIDATSNQLTTTIVHSSGQFWAATFNMPASQTPQQYGSSLTYARRYTLTALLGVFADEDDDGKKGDDADKRSKQKDKMAPALKPAVITPKSNETMKAEPQLEGVPLGQTREGLISQIGSSYKALATLEPEFDLQAAMFERYGASKRNELSDQEAWDFVKYLEARLKQGVGA